MEKRRSPAGSIVRRSIHTFLQNYSYFSSHTAFIALPFSASILLSQSFVTSSSYVLPLIYGRLQALFIAAGFPPSELFNFFSLKLSQTISSSILTIPFALTFLLFAKASILNTLRTHDRHGKGRPRPELVLPSLSSVMSIYIPLLHTYLWNSLLLISASATAFSILFFAFNLLQGLAFAISSPDTLLLLLSSAGALLYSIILANALIISNLALVLSGVEGRGGYMAILKACVLIRGRTTTALSLAVPISLAMAGIEALFQFRIVRPHHHHNHQNPNFFVAMEPLFISYLYSIFVVLDTIVSYMFLKSCNYQEKTELEYADEELGMTCGDKPSKELP